MAATKKAANQFEASKICTKLYGDLMRKEPVATRHPKRTRTKPRNPAILIGVPIQI